MNWLEYYSERKQPADRKCTECGLVKPLDIYHFRKRNRIQYRFRPYYTYCIKCTAPQTYDKQVQSLGRP